MLKQTRCLVNNLLKCRPIFYQKSFISAQPKKMSDLHTHGIIPDVLDEFKPSVPLNVSYSGTSVEVGKELTPTQVKDHPQVAYQADSDSLYTLILTGTYFK
jgi:hypothetical protein